MKPVPASRYLVFALLVGGGLFWDLYSKHAVFTDLGYPGGHLESGVEPVPGRHTLFDAPLYRQGESRPYLTGWTTFRLFTSFNRGALWGIGQRWTWLFALLSVAAAVGVIYFLFVHGAAHSLWLTVSLAAIMVGTLGNLWDRAGLHGCESGGEAVFGVRDFLLFTFGDFHWPVFNFADVFLVSGAILLVLHSFGARGESSPEAAGSASLAATAENPSGAHAVSRSASGEVN